METETNAPVDTLAPMCKTQICKRPLTFLEDSKCWRCLVCNPLNKKKPESPKEETKYLDVKVTEEQVDKMITERLVAHEKKIREIVVDELENYHITKPEIVDTIDNHPEMSHVEVVELTWRQEAKKLGIPLHKEPKGTGMRKKEDVLKDIAENQ